MLRHGRIARVILALLFLCAMVCAQSASFLSEHSHQHSSEHCCGLCHIGPLPLLQPAAVSGIAPIVTVAWLLAVPERQTPHDVLLAAGSSRAPPVPFSV